MNVTREPYTPASELGEILKDLRCLADRLGACGPQTLLIGAVGNLSQAVSELGGVLAWAKRREEAEQQSQVEDSRRGPDGEQP